MTDEIFIDVDYSQIYKHGQKIGGDVFLLDRSPEKNQIVTTLSDGLGSGVKAHVLASLTANMSQKLSFSPINIRHSAEIIMNTLPICNDKQIAYSTFSVANIKYNSDNDRIRVDLIEYENPDSLRFQKNRIFDWGRQTITLHRESATKEEVISFSSFNMVVGDRLIFFSDGVTQSGMDNGIKGGWGLKEARNFIQQKITANPDISSKELTRDIVMKALNNDGMKSKDDITCVCIFVRKPRKTLLFTGAPLDPASDPIVIRKVREFKGKKIISGGTTAEIAARELREDIRLDMSSMSKDVPPASKINGIDLVTEGILTLSKVANYLENKVSPLEVPNDAAKSMLELLLDSDQIHFIVGTRINIEHQSPNMPVELGIRRTIVKRLIKALEEIYLKDTSVEYF